MRKKPNPDLEEEKKNEEKSKKFMIQIVR